MSTTAAYKNLRNIHTYILQTECRSKGRRTSELWYKRIWYIPSMELQTGIFIILLHMCICVAGLAARGVQRNTLAEVSLILRRRRRSEREPKNFC